MYEHAVALDPNFALAYAGLANVFGLFYEWHEKDIGLIEKALAASDRALALQPELPEALAAWARISWAERNYDDAIEYAHQAIRRKPTCEGAYWTLGQAYFATDRWNEAAAVAEAAVEAIGDDYNVYVPYERVFRASGQADTALRLVRQQIPVLQRQLEWVPEDVRARILLALIFALRGNQDEAVREAQKAIVLRPNDSNILLNAAGVYAIIQRKAEALELLKQASRAEFYQWDYIARDPDFQCLHGDPEFEQLIEQGRRKEKKLSERVRTT
jgi:tetratricopeptide (TPR) repeat protein